MGNMNFYISLEEYHNFVQSFLNAIKRTIIFEAKTCSPRQIFRLLVCVESFYCSIMFLIVLLFLFFIRFFKFFHFFLLCIYVSSCIISIVI